MTKTMYEDSVIAPGRDLWQTAAARTARIFSALHPARPHGDTMNIANP